MKKILILTDYKGHFGSKHNDVPNISIDIAFNGNKFHLFEFQAVYFGTTTIAESTFYFMKVNDRWEMFKEKSELEKEYVDSIVKFINRKFGGSN